MKDQSKWDESLMVTFVLKWVFVLFKQTNRPVLAKFNPLIVNAERSVLEISNEVRKIVDEIQMT